MSNQIYPPTNKILIQQKFIEDQGIKKCAREECMECRAEIDGKYAYYCSKMCETIDNSKGAIVKN